MSAYEWLLASLGYFTIFLGVGCKSMSKIYNKYIVDFIMRPVTDVIGKDSWFLILYILEKRTDFHREVFNSSCVAAIWKLVNDSKI